MKDLTHVDSDGRPGMVDIDKKEITKRIAQASGQVYLGSEILSLLINGEIQSKKGAVFQTAIIAGTMAVKKTSELIPFCHPLPINGCKIDITAIDSESVQITCAIKTEGKTGVEMEALSGVSVAALTIYDMCKAMSHDIIISDIQLIKKTGGKSDVNRKA